MRARLAIGLVLLLVIGIAAPPSERNYGAERELAEAAMGLSDRSQPPHSPAPFSQRAAAAGFASIPDAGNLVRYPATAQIRRDGAYTWNRADVSESHALRAIADGLLSFRTPAGDQLRFRYERHIEHPSGDWTWIGRLEDGAASDQILLTFGERAVFGSIAQPGKAPLKLTIQGGVSWLVETDRALVAQIQNSATRPTKPDFLVPPKLGRNFEASTYKPFVPSYAPASVAHAPVFVGAAAAATNTVDVVLGYTTGFAASLGGQSQAITRLNNMVDIANQAYVNSQVDASVRLLHTVQVAYPDNTSNDDTLERLTGFRAPSTPTTPDPAFAALRAARDQYGADLVSLVRKFNTPENDGCGIAWLIGGGQSGIGPSDEYFGYSVVSDGTDAGPDGKNYFCREETLVHEFGHNMGSQHDRASATDNGTLRYGVYPYSFGFKRAPGDGNFYTVMAYGDTGQIAYRTFSNPRSTYCGGYACGIENDSDNARSLNQTIPLVTQFRATVVPVPVHVAPNDVDGGGISDVLFQRPGLLAYSIMNGAVISRSSFFSLSSSYHIATMGDYDGNGKLDIVWTSAANDLYVWMGNGNSFSAPISLGTYSAGWTLMTGGGDINGDGKSDLIWHRPGTLAYSIMNGAAIQRSSFFFVSSDYRVAATGDYDGNGKLDILWTSAANDLYVWLGSGENFLPAQFTGIYGAGWAIWPNGGDVDGDGKADILFHRPGALSYSVMNGATIVRSSFFPLSSNYYIAATGDYDANGKQDVLWTSNANDMFIWFGNGNEYAPPRFVSNYGVGWAIVK